MQIIGDTLDSKLNWTGAANTPMLQIAGPTNVVLSELSFTGQADCIEINTADQVGGLIVVRQSNNTGNVENLFVDGLNNTSVELQGFESGNASGSSGIIVNAGSAGGTTTIYGGVTANNLNAFSVTSTGRLNVIGVWSESRTGDNSLLQASGNGAISYVGAETSLTTGTHVGELSGFQGTAAFVGLDSGLSNDVYAISGNGSGGQVLGLGLASGSAPFWNDTTSPADTNGFILGQVYDNGNYLAASGTQTNAFIEAAMAQTRAALPHLPPAPRNGVTSALLSRISTGTGSAGTSCRYGLHFKN
jgi:hypothetical protein